MKKALLSLLLCGLPSAAQSVAGDWELTMVQFGESNHNRVRFEVDGDKLTGAGPGGSKIEGKITGQKLEFTVRQGERLIGSLSGTVEPAGIGGEGRFFDNPIRWTARRPAVRAGGPRVHDFAPKEFHRVFSALIPPVLRIFPGDTVRTWAVDAGGRDAQGVTRSMGGNPQTGPFYIEGAMPGDTLVVKLNRVRLNRDSAGSGRGIVGNALTPGYLMNLKRVENFDSNWKLDRERGIAMLAKPTERLKNYTVPLRPMLGCVAVAPPSRSGVISTGDSGGSIGGNMDYNQIREGATVYLPVNQPGALLFVGDGHAAEGDGELTGDALETSMDIEFTVEVRRRQSIGGPRAEDGEYIMAIGIAGSLDDALRAATTAMARWLETDYQLNSAEVAIVLGFSIRYDVADLVGTPVSIVAKVPKATLAQLGQP